MNQVNPQTILEDEGLFAAKDGYVAPLSKEELLFQSADQGSVHVMTDQVLRALDLCRPFRTIAEHVEVITHAIPALKEKRDAVAVVLKNLADRQLLVRASDYLKRLNDGSPEALPQDPPLVLTRGEQVSADADHCQVLDTALGNEEFRQRVVSDARDALPEYQDTIEWLLAGAGEGEFAAGQQRNLALLLGAGRRMAILDGDLNLSGRRMGVQDSGLTLAAASRAKLDFQPTYELAQEAGQPLDGDTLARLFEHCGRTVADLLAQPVAAGIGPQSLAGQDLATLGQFNGQSRVMAVTCGLYGVDRRNRPLWPFLLGAGAREQFAGDEEDYLQNRDGGYVWRTLSDHRLGALQDQSPWVVDGRSLLPPVIPGGRWEGGLFNALMRYLYPNDTCLELAIAVGHEDEPRRFFKAEEAAATVPELARFFADFADSRDNESRAAAAEDRLDFLGARMLDLAAADETTLRYKLREYVIWFRSTLVRSLQEMMLGWQESPVSWQTDIRALIEANGQALEREGSAAIDFGAKTAAEGLKDEGAQLTRLREALRRYGEALVVWPQLWNLGLEESKRWIENSQS